jgi:antitoxin (DNA-binding transcriptional repressor) of toxin-antitoxin stability system
MSTQPKSVGAADLKQRCLQILDELPPEGVIITKRGKAVARLLPVARSTRDLIGILKGRLKIAGDIVDTSDLTTGNAWSADEDNLSPRKKKSRKHGKR